MGRKRINHLGKYKKKRYLFKWTLKKLFILTSVIVSIGVMFFTTKHIEDLYKSKNIEKSKVEYYMNIADEAGKSKVQINWKELLAIDMVINNEDLSEIKKKDTLDIAKKFIIKTKDETGEYIYKKKSLDAVLENLNFTEKDKIKSNKYVENLEYMFLDGRNLDKKSKEIVFINKIEDMAIENYKNYKILPSITIAQSIIESGWGESELSQNSNNLFGIKVDKNWSGNSISTVTTENYNDKEVATFRAYNSISGSIKDHGEFLCENKRYKENGLFDATHYTTQAQALEDAGYSTKKNDKGESVYADILINLIRSYNLQLIDCKVQTIE